MKEEVFMVDQVPLLPYNLFMTEPPRLPVRDANDEGGPDFVVQAKIKEQHASEVVLEGKTCSGETLSITLSVVAEGIVRVLLEDGESDPMRVRLARTFPPDESKATIEQSETHVCLRTSSLKLEVALQPFHMAFYSADGRLLLSQNYSEITAVRMKLTILPFGLSKVNGRRVAFHDTFTAEPDEHFFGFGEKFTGFDKRGQRVTIWNSDCGGAWSERAYKNVPFFLSSRNYGIFVDSTSAVHFDMAASNTATFSLINPDNALDYYVITGPDPKSIITRYASLVSFPILPPKWSLGTWISSGFQRDSATEVLRRAKLIREHDIPCDVLHLDCYWQRFGRWSELLWDSELFPDPAGLLAELKALDFKVCLWMHPYIGTASERFVEGDKKGYFLKNQQGETYVVDIWGGFHPPVGIIDVTHPEAVAWFKELLREPLRMGAEVYKTDFGEGIPNDAVNYAGIQGERFHNLYTLLYNDIVADVTEEVTGHRLTWGRSTYAGGQRHAAQWSGDVNCTFTGMAATLRGGLSMAVCGHPFWSHDTGGFTGRPTDHLYVRWAQFGFFSPLVRMHGTSTRLPWDFGPQALEIIRSYARLRYRLLPYMYSYAVIAAQTSLPMLRPMLLEFADDPVTYTLDLQYMFGSELLVAPIFNDRGEHSIYLPEGRWVDYWTHEVTSGPRTLHVQVPLDMLPLYVRADALIPTTEPTSFTSDEPFNTITVDAYLFERGSFALYDTDGLTHITADLRDSRLDVTLEGVKHQLVLRLLPLPGRPSVTTVSVNEARYLEALSGEGQEHVQTWVHTPDGTVLVYINA
jgi:alpha-D-xyloside xylohydrolase